MKKLSKMLMGILFICFIFEGTAVFSQTGNKPEAEIKIYKGKPTVFVNGKPNSLSSYMIDATYPGDMPYVYGANYDVYYIHPAYYPFWPENCELENFKTDQATLDIYKKGKEYIDNAAARILKNSPNSFIIPRFYIQPPEWWVKNHPSELALCETGESTRTPSLASDMYYQCASEYSAEMVRYIESRPWSDHVIGYLNINVEEGCHMPVSSGYLFDHNPYMIKRWRDFLKVKYVTVEDLRKAYNDSTLKFETMETPKDKLRGTVYDVSNMLYLQNAIDNQPLRDYLELTRDIYHQRYRQLGEAMKKAVNRKVLFFYDGLKQTLPGWNHNAYFGGIYDGPAQYRFSGIRPSQAFAYPDFIGGSGDINVAELLSDKSVWDGIWTPHDYQARGIGGVYEPEGISDSAVLHGKYFTAEMDTRGDYDIFPAVTAKNWAAITWRNIATGLARGFNSCYTPVFMDSLFFRSEGIQKTYRRQVEVMKESVEWEHETVPGIAMVLDDAAILETTGSGPYAYETVMWEQKLGMARCGVPHNIYLFEDLALDNFPKHKVFYFPNLFRIDEKKLEILKKKVFRDGNVVIWGPETGLSDGVTIDMKHAEKVTGFNFEFYNHNYPRRVIISNYDHPITKNLNESFIFGNAVPFGPIILPIDGLELGHAWVSRGNTHQVGLAIKEWGKGAAGNGKPGKRGDGDYAAIFTAAVQIPPELWRNIARYSGEHIYCETNDVIMADKSIVAVHSLKSEKKTISLPGKYNVRDVITGKMAAKNTNLFSFETNAPDTKIFLLENPK